MNRPSFNVLTEPWIPVIRLDDGSTDELGILQCLQEAHDLREIRDPAPIIEFGLYRLLVAFVLDALILADRRPEDVHDLRDLLAEGRVDPGMIGGYARRCGDVFDLFDPERPFLQRADARGEQKSVFDFYPVFPSGANVVHFCHQTADDQLVTHGGAARLLAMVSPFNVKVRTGSPRTIVGDPPIYALPVGKSLHETLILNLPLRNPRFTTDEERESGPIWRSAPREGQSGTTPAQSFTWPCRFVRLGSPDTDGHVRNLVNAKGLRALAGWKDPSCAVFEGDEGRVRHLRLQESRPMWLDAGPLSFRSTGTVRRGSSDWAFVRPEVISNALNASTEMDLRTHFYAWRTDQAKVLEWMRAHWAVPRRLGQSARLGALVQHELDRAEDAAYRLRRSLRALHPADNRQSLGQIVRRCERAFWHRLESGFHPLMSAFAALSEDAADDPSVIGAAARHWRASIRDTAVTQFELAANDMDVDGDALERQVRARTRLHVGLKEVLS